DHVGGSVAASAPQDRDAVGVGLQDLVGARRRGHLRSGPPLVSDAARGKESRDLPEVLDRPFPLRDPDHGHGPPPEKVPPTRTGRPPRAGTRGPPRAAAPAPDRAPKCTARVRRGGIRAPLANRLASSRRDARAPERPDRCRGSGSTPPARACAPPPAP